MVSRISNSQSRMFFDKNQARLVLIGPQIRSVKPCGELLKRYDSREGRCRLDWIQKIYFWIYPNDYMHRFKWNAINRHLFLLEDYRCGKMNTPYFGPKGAITSTEARCGESNNIREKANQFLLTPLNQMVARANRILRRMAPFERGREE